uniref:MI domain-containing protein n=1 Tax=Parastrongyloides trichosuri TaxID=131310 RepID=A0A0N4ZN64_PARTI
MDINNLLNTKNNRKEARKQKKEFKKLAKEAYHKKKKLIDVIDEKFDKKKDNEEKKKKKKKKKPKNKIGKETAEIEAYKRRMFEDPEDAKPEKLSREEEIERKEMLKQQEERDDEDIEYYEKLLGIGSKKKKVTEDDGYDYLLDFCDLTTRKKIVNEEKELFDIPIENEIKDDDVEEFFDEKDDEIAMDECLDEEFEDEEDVMDEENDVEMISDNEDEEEINASEDEIVEDIYGRRIYKSSGMFVDKETRLQEKLIKLEENKSEISKEDTLKIEKSIRAVMNRLSEASLVNSQKIMFETWNQYSKNDVKRLTYNLLLQAIDKTYDMADRMIMEYGAFLTILHSTVSVDLTYYIIENLICDFVNRIKQKIANDGHRINNIGRFLCSLYNFRILKTSFIIELLSIIYLEINEFNLSLLQSMYTSVGNSLKKRDGTIFEEHLSSMRKQLPLLADIKDNFKYKFLIEQMLDLKVANINKFTSKFDENDMLHMIKVIQGLTKKNNQKEGELGMSVDDLLHATDRGRWWIVGSAWQPSQIVSANESSCNNKKSFLMNFPPELLLLAKKAKMNLEHRKNIFCIIMSGDDSLDVFQRIMSLNLKETQERDIIHVLIICCTLERNYNPFYSSIIDQFCSFNNRFKLTTQFALWDRIKNLNEFKKRQRNNLAFIIADLIKKESIGLGVLRIIDFGDIEGINGHTLKIIFNRFLSTTSSSKIRDILQKMISNPKYELLSKGLELFFEIKYQDEEITDDDFKSRLQVVRNIFSSRDL